MRERNENGGISVHAISGTEVVLLGLNATEKAASGLLGFTISKRKGRKGKFWPIVGERGFEGMEGSEPILQGFMWSDYQADPKSTYTYRVLPVYGEPGNLSKDEDKAVEVGVTTEDPEDQTHAVYFNRGVAGSQAYSRQFGDHRKWYKTEQYGREEWRQFVKPEDVPDRKAYEWLSRGLEEAMLDFIAQAKSPEYALRAAVYEFTYLPVIQAFADAIERGADVKIVHHAKREKLLRLKVNKDAEVTVSFTKGEQAPAIFKNRELVNEPIKDGICSAADAAVKRIGVEKSDSRVAFGQMMTERTITQISHNKFIILLKDGKPIQVWTGSTNFTAGGIFGQSNVGHIVRDEAVAQKYLDYWEKLVTDPPRAGMRDWTVLQQPDLKGPPPPNRTTVVFSPRSSDAMLQWYADRLAAAAQCVFFTAAFSVATEIFEKVKERKRVGAGQPYLRYLLLESKGGSMKKKYDEMCKCKQNRIAWGDVLRTPGAEDKHEQFIETLTGLNDHVEYLHTKYMLIDPLSEDPVVITGSANFSTNSTVNNDENMLIIRGDTRVADIFLGEFMRLFNHYRWRNEVNSVIGKEAQRIHYLCRDDSWTEPYYTNGAQEQSERLLFA